MKTQAKTILKFKKSNVAELNRNQLNSIVGGTGSVVSLEDGITPITNSLRSSCCPPEPDSNGSSEFCLTTTG